MLWPITTASLFVYFAWSEIFRNSWRFMDLMFSCFFLTFGTALAALVGVGIAALIGLFIPKTWYGPESTELVSLRGSDGTSGTFFLGSGAIQAEHFYFFYRKAGEGYRPDRISTSQDVIVFERDRADGEMISYHRDFKHPIAWLFGINGQKPRYEFSIPSGSIKKGFSL